MSWTFGVSATSPSGISERQALLGISGSSYLVISTQREVKGSHFSLYQRIALREYTLESNELIKEWALYSNELITDPGTLEKSIRAGTEHTSSLASVLGSKFTVLASHPSVSVRATPSIKV